MNIKIDFCDFWEGFNKTENYFFWTLNKYFQVEISSNPDLVIYSCYGNEYLQYSCIRIQYISENERPDFTACDYAISFDYDKRKKQLRLPLYVLYAKHYSWEENLIRTKITDREFEQWNRRKFACIVISNSNARERVDFFNELSKYKIIDSGGRWKNNVGGPVKNKLEFIKNYKFVLSFENSSFPGYITEKLIEPLICRCIPIYWGDPLIGNNFNKDAFVEVKDMKNLDRAIEKIKKLDADSNLVYEMLNTPIFINDRLPEYFDESYLISFFESIVKSKKTPIANTNFRYIHILRRKIRIGGYYTKKFLGMNFR